METTKKGGAPRISNILLTVLTASLLTSCAAMKAPEKERQSASSGPVNFPAAVFPYPANGVTVGQGWDTFNNAGTAGSCVNVDTTRLERSSFSSDVQQVISTYSLLRTVETSVSASYKGAGGKVKASASTSSSRQVKSDDQNFLFNFESWDGSTFAVPPGSVLGPLAHQELREIATQRDLNDRIVQSVLAEPSKFPGGIIRLTKEAAALLSKPDEFRRHCGEGFVAAIHRGVRVQLLLSQSGASREEKDALRAALSASGYGASGRASYSRSTEMKTALAKLGYRVFQDGGAPLQTGALKNASDRLDVSSMLPSPEDLLANPTAFRVVVIPYANIDGRAAGSLATPLNLMTIGDYYIALNDVYNMVQDYLSGVQVDSKSAAIRLPAVSADLLNAFGGIPHLERISDEMLADLSFLESILDQCYRTRQACTLKEATRGAVQELAASIKVHPLSVQSADLEQIASQAEKRLSTKDLNTTEGHGQKAADAADQLDDARELATMLRLHDSVIDDEPSLGFFLRFYWYLSQIPPPVTVLDPNLKVTNKNEVIKKVNDVNAGLTQAMLNHRMQPWKAFFCNDLKSEPLCVPDSWIRELMSQYTYIGETAITIEPPPAPKRKKKCKWPKCWW